jgi:hypothetical protein
MGEYEVVEFIIMTTGWVWLLMALVSEVMSTVVKPLRHFVETFLLGERIFWRLVSPD